MPSGTMAQQIALRIHADRKKIPAFACHPSCHLEIHEDWAYSTLHHLHAELIGSRHAPITIDNLNNLHMPISTLLLEVPNRPLGGVLRPWKDLGGIINWARERGIALHLDGARLWEAKPFYGREYAEIAGLFDTVYVSFYKILGGIAGAALAGPADFIAEARVWQHRHGGRLIHAYPLVLSAMQGLSQHIDRIPLYCAKARDVAAALEGLPGIEITPNPPDTNMFRLYLRGDSEQLLQAAMDIGEETGVWLLRGPRLGSTEIPAYQFMEFVADEGTLDFSTEEIAGLYAALLDQANHG